MVFKIPAHPGHDHQDHERGVISTRLGVTLILDFVHGMLVVQVFQYLGQRRLLLFLGGWGSPGHGETARVVFFHCHSRLSRYYHCCYSQIRITRVADS
jgi:hypothetical protein